MRLFLPKIVRSKAPETLENEIYRLIAESPHQQRKVIKRHPLLDKACRLKAQDMASKNYFSHTSPEGWGENYFVRLAGYTLPDFYLDTKNFVASIYLNGRTAQKIADGWYSSPSHRTHVFGIDKFFREQECVGVGVVFSGKDREDIVFISAPCVG